jgi:hypothetical protein
LPEATPANIRALLRRCLQRDRDQRVHDMSDVRIEIDEALASTAESGTGAAQRRRPRLSGIEIGAIAVIVFGGLLNIAVLTWSVPTLAGIFAGYGMALSFPLRAYIFTNNTVLRLAPFIVLMLAGTWALYRMRAQAFPARLRALLLVGTAAVGLLITAMGLYSFGRDGMQQAVRMSVAAGAPSQVLQRDLAMLYLASGQAAAAIKLLDPRVDRDVVVGQIRFGSPGEAFLLAESYRAINDVAKARLFYERAQQAAVKFDEELVSTLQANQVRYETQWGREFSSWLPPTSDLRRLPDLIRSVSQQRLDELRKQQNTR